MVTSFNIVNATIPIGSPYDNLKFILGDLVDNRIQLIPKLTEAEFKTIAKKSNLSVYYKIYNTTTKLLLMWDGTEWAPVNDAVAGNLVSNTVNGQTVIKISDTASPSVGQVLTATSATTAVWADSAGGSGPSLTNASYTTLIGNGIKTTINVVHSLNTEAILYGIWEATGEKRVVDCTVSIVDTNTLAFHFTNPPATNSLKVTILSAVFSNVSTGTALPNQAGNSGKYLTTDGNNPFWNPIPTWMANPMSSPGDIILGGTDGAAGRLGIGTVGQVLTVSDNTLVWSTQVPSMTGQSGRYLTNDGSNPSWASILDILSISGTTTNKILTNNGIAPVWITNTNPPDVLGQSGKYLTNNGVSTAWASISEVPSVTGHAGKILLNDGGSKFWSPLVNAMPSVATQSGKFLTTDGTNILWETPPSGFANPMDAVGDLIIGGATGTPQKLAKGSIGQVLSTLSNGSLGWENVLDNPMTSQGDIIYGNASGVPTRLAIAASGYFLGSTGSSPTWVQGNLVPTVAGNSGKWLTNDGTNAYWSSFTQIPTQTGNNGRFLTTDGSNLSWINIPAGFANPMTTAGDIITATAGGAAARVSIGTEGQFLSVSSGAPTWTTIQTLPSQSTHSGKYLTTNGTLASWSQIYQVPSVVGQTGKFLGTLDGITYNWEIVPNTLPTMSGQAGKYLFTDGLNASWVPYNGLPELTGNSGKILSTDGVTSFWITPSGASGTVLSRLPIQVTSSVLAVSADEIKIVDTTCKTFQIQKITSDSPCRIRIYATQTAATLDRARLASIDPTGNHKMYLEAILTQAVPSISCSPVPTCVNLDTPSTTNTYITIENLGTVSKAIVLDLELMKFE